MEGGSGRSCRKPPGHRFNHFNVQLWADYFSWLVVIALRCTQPAGTTELLSWVDVFSFGPTKRTIAGIRIKQNSGYSP